MSRATRLQILRQNLARQTNNWEQYDKDIAFSIYMLEKEFHIGIIDDKFPLLKFWNLLSEDNNKRYEAMIKRGSKESPKTLG